MGACAGDDGAAAHARARRVETSVHCRTPVENGAKKGMSTHRRAARRGGPAQHSAFSYVCVQIARQPWRAAAHNGNSPSRTCSKHRASGWQTRPTHAFSHHQQSARPQKSTQKVAPSACFLALFLIAFSACSTCACSRFDLISSLRGLRSPGQKLSQSSSLPAALAAGAELGVAGLAAGEAAGLLALGAARLAAGLLPVLALLPRLVLRAGAL
jgi:hypothetical protein